MKKFAVLPVLVLLVFSVNLFAQNSTDYSLLRQPTLSRTQIAFSYAGDIWVVPRQGGMARRLTAGVGSAMSPRFSPDGGMIAYTAKVDGNADVYVIPSNGGVARRLTFHPSDDQVVGWTPDGKILFTSDRNTFSPTSKLFAITMASGGFPYELPLPIVDDAAYSPDATRIAYVPVNQWQRAWKRYRGGQTKRVWLVNVSDLSVEAVPRENSNDFNPMWIGDKVYFLSDRNGPVTLFAYDTKSKQVKQAIANNGLDFKAASAGPDAIVYEQFGKIFLYDLQSGESKRVQIEVSGDLPALHPRYAKVTSKQIVNFGISPTGARAVFETHGEILTVPAEKGDIRNLTNTTNAAEREPSWSPDGKWVAYFSDATGEYALELKYQDGIKETKRIPLGPAPTYYYAPAWSPDSKRIAYSDKHGNLYFLDLDKPAPKLVDTDPYADSDLGAAWSPDAKWIAYVKNQRNMRKSLFLYSVEQGKSYPVTDTMTDARTPRFDVNGKYLYFTTSTDEGLSQSWLDMSSLNHPVTRSVYVAVLDKTLPSPIPPESDDEKVEDAAKPADTKDVQKDDAKKEDAKKDDKEKKPVVVKVDTDGIDQRILALPIPAKNYQGLWAGKEGILFLAEGPMVDSIDRPGPPPMTIQKFDLSKRKVDKVVDGVTKFALSANGEKILFQQGNNWTIAATDKEIKPGEGALKMASMRVYVDPQQEWKQMYNETWRIEREFFYDPHFHGLDIAATEKKYAPYVDHLSCREDLTYLQEEMLGELTVGHMFVRGPREEAENVKGGLLGADYTVDNGRYRFSRVYNGENWNPDLRAPLTQPGVNVQAGEYLLAVNGRELKATDNLYSFFEATAGKEVTIKVGPTADGKGAREVVVVPVDDEFPLRNLAWIEGNRRKVDQMTGGRVAYVWLPDTGGGGYSNFNRYFFAQMGKEGAVIDERFNGGGLLADYIVDYLSRKQQSCLTGREGDFPCSPASGIFGPKAMIVNEFAGSGGDALPWYFRKMNIGTLVGKRTWGGLVGIGGYPQLLDGGSVTAPRWALYGLNGEWEVENRGIAPDIEVELDPKAVAQGHDPQLERAVKVVMEQLEKNPPVKYAKPQYPNYHGPATAVGK